MSSVIEYVFNSLAWSAIGFLVGWLVASLRSDVHTIREAIVQEDAAQQRKRAKTRDTARQWVGIAIALLAVGTVVQGVIAQQRLNDISDCQSSYNRHFAAASKTRAQLADDDRRALNDLLLTLYDQREASQRERLRIFERWVATAKRNERARQRTPLPDYPRNGRC